MRHQRADHQKWIVAVQSNEAHGRVWVRKTEGGSGNARSSCGGGRTINERLARRSDRLAA